MSTEDESVAEGEDAAECMPTPRGHAIHHYSQGIVECTVLLAQSHTVFEGFSLSSISCFSHVCSGNSVLLSTLRRL